MLSCSILTTEPEVEAIAGEWRQLHAAAGKSPFSQYEWFQIWWRILGKKRPCTLHVVTARENGRLVGVLPLGVTRRRGVRFLHAGGHKAFYYCDMIAENDMQALQLWQAAKNSPRYDIADIRDVYPQSPCFKALSVIARPRDVSEAYYLPIKWSSSAEWVTSLTSKRRSEFKRQHRRLEERGPVRFETCAAHPIPVDVIDGMVRLKIAWCTENEKDGLFGHPHVDEYFHRLLETGARQGQVMLTWLTCRNKPIAYNLCFRYCDVLYGYIITYDPEWRRYSPGHLLMSELIKWAVDNKLQGFDLRQGGGSYKSLFSCQKYHCAEFTFGRGLRGEIMETLFITSRNLIRTMRRREEEIVDFDILEAGAGEKKEGTDAPGS